MSKCKKPTSHSRKTRYSPALRCTTTKYSNNNGGKVEFARTKGVTVPTPQKSSFTTCRTASRPVPCVMRPKCGFIITHYSWRGHKKCTVPSVKLGGGSLISRWLVSYGKVKTPKNNLHSSIQKLHEMIERPAEIK